MATAQNRLEGLSEAKDALDKAWASFREAAFDAARASAEKSITLAESASVPQSTSIISTEAQRTSQVTTSQAIGLGSMLASPVVIVGVAALILITIGLVYLRRRPPRPTEEVPTRKFCINCGTSLPGDTQTCEKCGSKQS